MEQPPKFIVTLVHGTFLWPFSSPPAIWTQPGSALREAVESYTDGEVLFFEFTWSGKNLPKHRYKAALDLARIINRRLRKFPFAEHVLICHSHGGNVALKAAALAKKQHLLHICCLSTPFTHVSRRDIPLSLRSSTQLGVILGAALFWSGLQFILRSFIVHLDWISYIIAALITAGAALVYDKEKRTVERWAGRASLNNSLSVDICIIRAVGDEALASLGAFELLAWAANAASDKVNVYAEEASRNKLFQKYRLSRRAAFINVVRNALAFLMASAFSYIAQLLGHHAGLSAFFSVLALMTAIVAILFFLLFLARWALDNAVRVYCFVVAIVLPVVDAVLATLIFLCTIPFGNRSVLLGLLYRISSEPTPVGRWQVHQIVPQMQASMNHSAITVEPEALRILCRWMTSIAMDRAKLYQASSLTILLILDCSL